MSEDADRVIGLYDRNAEAFDLGRWRTLFEKPWLDRFLTLVKPRGTILDIGCGSGEPIARYFIAAEYRVTGIDSSSAMIALCTARFPQESWRVVDMRALSLGRQFNGLLAWDSFFHLTAEDQRRMFPIFGLHASPGAALMFTSGPRGGEAMGTLYGEPLYHASLEPDEYRALLAANGFEVVSYDPEDAGCGGHTIWIARHR